jgi:hypothetical protein
MTEIKKYYFAIDIEKAGDRFIDPILMIGCCLGDEHGNVIESKAFCGKVPEVKDFDPRCYREFWSKELPILERIRVEGEEQTKAAGGKEMLDRFMEYYYELDQRFGPFTRSGNKRLILLSDNPAYDISAIDQALLKSAVAGSGYKFPLRYTSSGEYCRVEDPSDRCAFLTKKAVTRMLELIHAEIPHDHWAENDAIGIYKWMIQVNHHIKTRKFI